MVPVSLDNRVLPTYTKGMAIKKAGTRAKRPKQAIAATFIQIGDYARPRRMNTNFQVLFEVPLKDLKAGVEALVAKLTQAADARRSKEE